MSRIYTIPSDAAFVDSLAEGLWRQAAGDPLRLASYLVLMPTRRACRHLREAFLRATGGQAALLPRLQPLGDVDETELYFTGGSESLDLPPAITPLRRQLLLTQLARKADAALPLDQAVELAAALADLLDQAQIEGLDFANLEKLVPEDYAEHWQRTLKFLGIVTALWPAILAEEGCLDPAQRRNLALKAQANSWRGAPPDFPIVAAGSTGSIPAVAELLAVIAALPQGSVVLPGLDQQTDEATWQAVDEGHPQYGLKRWLEKAGCARVDVALWPEASTPRPQRVRLLQEALRPATTTQAWRHLTPESVPCEAYANLTRLEAEHQQDEADLIALRLRAALEEPGKTVALITPDRALAERVAAGLQRWGITANDSAGASLAQLTTGSFLRAVLQAAAPDAGALDFLALLKHPVAAAGLPPAQCRQQTRRLELAIWRGLRRANGWEGAVQALRATLKPNPENQILVTWLNTLAAAFAPLTASWNEPLSLLARMDLHSALAEQLAATPDETGASRLWRGATGEAAAAWLADFRAAAEGFPPLTGDDYARLFTGLLRAVAVHPTHGEHPRLSILGPLEARLIQTDLVILGGLNEGTWPPEAPPDPWLSRPMKRQFGLPLPERKLGLAAHDFVQLASAPEVLLTRARRVGGAPTVPSRYLLQLEAVLQAVGHQTDTLDVLQPLQPWAFWARQLDAAPELRSCAAPRPCPPAAHRPRALSVTEISLWQRNPYAIYARHVLKLESLEPIDADVSASERGTVIHAALENFLRREAAGEVNLTLPDLLAEGRAQFAPFADRPQVAAFWWPRFERCAAWFIAMEKTRRQAGLKTLRVEAAGCIAIAGGAFKLKGRADRIDLRPDGTAAIIDYKTGGVPSQKEVALGYEPQLPLLGLMAAMGGFAEIGKLEIGELAYWKLQGGSDPAEVTVLQGDLPAMMETAWHGLHALIEKFADPQTPYEAIPKPRFAPRYDDYAHLARLAEWGRMGEET